MTKVKVTNNVTYTSATKPLLSGIYEVLNDYQRDVVEEVRVPHAIILDGTSKHYNSLVLLDLKDGDPVIIPDALSSLNGYDGSWEGSKLAWYMEEYHVPVGQAYVIMLLDNRWCGARLTDEDRENLKGPEDRKYTPERIYTQKEITFGDRRKEKHTAYLVDILREVGILRGFALSKMPSLLKVNGGTLGIFHNNVSNVYRNNSVLIPQLYGNQKSSSQVDLKERTLTFSINNSDIVFKDGEYQFKNVIESFTCSMDDNEALLEQAFLFSNNARQGASILTAHTELENVFQQQVDNMSNLPQVNVIKGLDTQGVVSLDNVRNDVKTMALRALREGVKTSHLSARITLLDKDDEVLDDRTLVNIVEYLTAVKLLPIADSAINYYASTLSMVQGDYFNRKVLTQLLCQQITTACEEAINKDTIPYENIKALQGAIQGALSATSYKEGGWYSATKYNAGHRNLIVKLTGKKANHKWVPAIDTVPVIEPLKFVIPNLHLPRETSERLVKLAQHKQETYLRGLNIFIKPSIKQGFAKDYQLKKHKNDEAYSSSYTWDLNNSRKQFKNALTSSYNQSRFYITYKETCRVLASSEVSQNAFKEIAEGILSIGERFSPQGIKKLGKKMSASVGGGFLLDTIVKSSVSTALFKNGRKDGIDHVLNIFTEGNLKWAIAPENELLFAENVKDNLRVDFNNDSFSQLYRELSRLDVQRSAWYTETKIRPLLEYLLVDCVNRQHVPNPMSEYADYLMAYNYLVQGGYRDWSRFDEFPQSLRLQHDITTAEHTALSEGISDDDFAKQYRDITLTNLNQVTHMLPLKRGEVLPMVLIAPTNEEALKDEGLQLDHCVGGYGQSIKTGSRIILFLRHAETPEKALITVEFNKFQSKNGITRYRLGQVEGRKNNVSIPATLKNALTGVVNELNNKCTAISEGGIMVPFENPKKKKNKNVDALQLV